MTLEGNYSAAELRQAYLRGYAGCENVCPYRSATQLAYEWRQGWKDRTEVDTGWKRRECNYRIHKREVA